MKNKITLLLNLLMLLLSNILYSQVTSIEVAVNQNNFSNFDRNIQEIQNLPYPIVFIHGLNSDSNVWNEMKDFMTTNLGLSYGGRLDFCLNDNGSNTSNNKLVYPTTNADIHRYNNMTLTNADFYLINFDVSWVGVPFTNSSNDVLSNEAAIVKQGVALNLAIEEILQVTGRDKVVLFGHSMGGLAAREYLQNQTNWQSDGNHHVAKLITTGTPHGGYEGTAIVSNPTDPIDWQSDAYRDLRHSYFVSQNDGVYLFGGTESFSVMNNNIFYDFYNVDVNCNGVINESIVGLNQKSLWSDVDYAYIIGQCTGCPTSFEGDGVVRDYNANFSNFYTFPLPKNEFIYSAVAALEIHSDLPKQIIQNMQALDEPNERWIGYELEYNKIYKGYIYNQPVSGYTFDYDDYKFFVNGNSQVNILINNITSSVLYAKIFDTDGNQIGTTFSGNPSSAINISQQLNTGNYILEIFATPVLTSTIYPYNFSLTTNLSTDDFESNDFIVHPNPTSSKIFITSKEYVSSYEIYNTLGQKVKEGSFNAGLEQEELDLTALQNWLYILNFKGEKVNKTVRIVKQ
jgi:triacylglycerol esterase/lipase EstA (alpha/beta hydrolase family)